MFTVLYYRNKCDKFLSNNILSYIVSFEYLTRRNYNVISALRALQIQTGIFLTDLLNLARKIDNKKYDLKT